MFSNVVAGQATFPPLTLAILSSLPFLTYAASLSTQSGVLLYPNNTGKSLEPAFSIAQETIIHPKTQTGTQFNSTTSAGESFHDAYNLSSSQAEIYTNWTAYSDLPIPEPLLNYNLSAYNLTSTGSGT